MCVCVWVGGGGGSGRDGGGGGKGSTSFLWQTLFFSFLEGRNVRNGNVSSSFGEFVLFS